MLILLTGNFARLIDILFLLILLLLILLLLLLLILLLIILLPLLLLLFLILYLLLLSDSFPFYRHHLLRQVVYLSLSISLQTRDDP